MTNPMRGPDAATGQMAEEMVQAFERALIDAHDAWTREHGFAMYGTHLIPGMLAMVAASYAIAPVAVWEELSCADEAERVRLRIEQALAGSGGAGAEGEE